MEPVGASLLTESTVLAVIGGGGGVLLAFLALPLLKSVLPAGMPRAPEIGLSFPVLVFAAAASLLTGLLFGTVPALRPGAALDLAAGRRVLSPRHRTSRFLVTVEVALALVLLSSAGLLLESLRRAWHVDLGFRKDTLTMRLQLSSRAYPDAHRVRAFRQELLRRVCALPGVEYAGTVSSLPLGIIMQGTGFVVAGRPETERESPFASYANVSRDYLRAIGIPLVAGRYFEAQRGACPAPPYKTGTHILAAQAAAPFCACSSKDGDDTPAGPPVAIVSESLARDWWPRREALGKRIRFDDTWFTIVGIAKDVRQDSPERPARRQIYALNQQLPESSQGAAMGRFNVLAVRTTGDPVAVVAAVRRAVADIDKNQPVAAVETMERLVEHSLAARRLNTLLLSLFAGLAVTLAAVGVFGLASYAVTRRTREIGIRMALGATPASVLAMVARESLLLAIAGAAIGLGATMAISRFLARFLFGVKPLDPEIVGAVAIVLVAIVVGSGLLPARRAMRVDPVVALRQD